MRSLDLVILFAGIALSGLHAQRHEAGTLGEVETMWPGIRYQLLKLERIPPDRLLVALRISATREASASGTLIGTKVSVPANISQLEALSARYAPRPLSLASSKMIDEQTGRQYPALPPMASAERKYIPGEILSTLFPGQSEVLTVQFSVPPSGETASQKQSASLLFPNAKGPIAKVPIPPSLVPGDPAGQSR